MFGERQPGYQSILRGTAKLVIERIANSDALYHDSHHTLMVTLVGQAILKGRLLVHEVHADDWLHFTIALLCHDLGYLRGICPGDTEQSFVISEQGDMVRAPRGASDAFLTAHHIERGKIFVRHRGAMIEPLDPERIARAIELTRFPVPEDNDHAETDSEAGLLRAADLIGQLADPFYPRKLNALYHEFAETGVAERLGYKSPGRSRRALPALLLAGGRALHRRCPGAPAAHRRGQAVDRPPLCPRVRRGAPAGPPRPAARRALNFRGTDRSPVPHRPRD